MFWSDCSRLFLVFSLYDSASGNRGYVSPFRPLINNDFRYWYRGIRYISNVII